MAWTTIWGQNFASSVVYSGCVYLQGWRIECWYGIVVWVYVHCRQGKPQEMGLQEESVLLFTGCFTLSGYRACLCLTAHLWINQRKIWITSRHTVLYVWGMFRLLAVLDAQRQCPLDWAASDYGLLTLLQTKHSGVLHWIVLLQTFRHVEKDVCLCRGGLVLAMNSDVTPSREVNKYQTGCRC